VLVVATAGHVDHGKSALVRALTGTEPDRWAEERRRGMTIDLGFAWAGDVTFVDVPGHASYLTNMLAGLGPVSAVMLVVAADEGWRAQTEEHLRAIELLGTPHVVPVVTRADLADPSRVTADTAARLGAEVSVVSATSGAGLADLRARLDRLAAAVGPTPDLGRPRLWVDRVFTKPGAGTVVTGTLTGGSFVVGDQVSVAGHDAVVRGLHSRGVAVPAAQSGTRVAISLRGVAVDDVRRGDAVVRPGAWHRASTVDARVAGGPAADDLPADLVLHVGSAAVGVRLRPLGPSHARLTLTGALELAVGDRALLRQPGGRGLVAGAEVLEPDPPPLRRRGAAAARGEALTSTTLLARRGVMRAADLARSGAPVDPAVVTGEWLVHPQHWARLVIRTADLARTADGITVAAAAEQLGLPDDALVTAVAQAAGVPVLGGRLTSTTAAVEPVVGRLLDRLAQHPFDPEAPTLDPPTAAVAARHGHVLRLSGGVCLQPDALATAARLLAGVAQPFSVGDARDALSSSRRVVVPVLEALDAAGRTRRLPDGRRVIGESQIE